MSSSATPPPPVLTPQKPNTPPKKKTSISSQNGTGPPPPLTSFTTRLKQLLLNGKEGEGSRNKSKSNGEVKRTNGQAISSGGGGGTPPSKILRTEGGAAAAAGGEYNDDLMPSVDSIGHSYSDVPPFIFTTSNPMTSPSMSLTSGGPWSPGHQSNADVVVVREVWPGWAKCVVCWDDNTRKNPFDVYGARDFIILPCLHSVCKRDDCIKTLFCCETEQQGPAIGTKSRCFQCRKALCYSEELISTVIHPLNFVDSPERPVTTQSSPVVGSAEDVCTLCIRGGPATASCETCEKRLCHICTENHPFLVAFAGHKITISEPQGGSSANADADSNLGGGEDNQTFELPCSIHPDSGCSMYCKPCGTGICPKCVDTRLHDRHQTCSLEEEAERLVKDLVKRGTDIQRHQLFDIVRRVGDFGDILNAVHSTELDKTREEAASMLKQIDKQIHQTSHNTRRDLTNQVLESMDALSVKEKECTDEIKSIFQFRDYVKALSKGGSRPALFQEGCKLAKLCFPAQEKLITRFTGNSGEEYFGLNRTIKLDTNGVANVKSGLAVAGRNILRVGDSLTQHPLTSTATNSSRNGVIETGVQNGNSSVQGSKVNRVGGENRNNSRDAAVTPSAAPPSTSGGSKQAPLQQSAQTATVFTATSSTGRTATAAAAAASIIPRPIPLMAIKTERRDVPEFELEHGGENTIGTNKRQMKKGRARARKDKGAGIHHQRQKGKRSRPQQHTRQPPKHKRSRPLYSRNAEMSQQSAPFTSALPVAASKENEIMPHSTFGSGPTSENLGIDNNFSQINPQLNRNGFFSPAFQSTPKVKKTAAKRPKLPTRPRKPLKPRKKRTRVQESLKVTNESDHDDYCCVCRDGGEELVCCDKCPKIFHPSCHMPALSGTPKGYFQCNFCRSKEDAIDPEKQIENHIRLTGIQGIQNDPAVFYRACKFLSEVFEIDNQLKLRVSVPRINSETSAEQPSAFFMAQRRLVKCRPMAYVHVKEMLDELFQALDDYDRLQRKVRKKSSAPIVEFRRRLKLVLNDYFPEYFSSYSY